MSRLDEARAWLAQDPDPTTRDALAATIEAAQAGSRDAAAELEDAFGSRLAFGTAGLRGALGAGPNRMNRVLVGQASAGFAAFLVERAASTGAARPSVVVGYDGRVNSDVFARDAAEIMAGAGVRAILLPVAAPTPVTAFAVRHLDVSAGVMITASHNPPRDNGFKVYLGDDDEGSQIVPPVDAAIADSIAAVAASRTFGELPRGEVEVADDAVWRAYVEATAAIAGTPIGEQPRVVYTAMHGVGSATVRAVLERAGFDPVVEVAEQAEPDGAFPTVAFPNPEEPGALDLAIAAATAASADLIVANDPDADRLSVAVPDGDGGWRQLTGNEVGLLLGWDAARSSHGHGTLAASIVSSPGLEVIARAHDLDYAETLTGFKWVSRAPGLVYGYEEALGYLVNPETVRDKDGVSALVRVLTLAGELHARGSSLADELIALAAEFGGFASGQVSVRVTALPRIGEIMARLRASPPASLAGVDVAAVDDLSLPEHGAMGDILRLTLADGSRVMVRPSGTEPKVKVYVDAVCLEGPPQARLTTAQERVAAIEEAVRPLLA